MEQSAFSHLCLDPKGVGMGLSPSWEQGAGGGSCKGDRELCLGTAQREPGRGWAPQKPNPCEERPKRDAEDGKPEEAKTGAGFVLGVPITTLEAAHLSPGPLPGGTGTDWGEGWEEVEEEEEDEED